MAEARLLGTREISEGAVRLVAIDFQDDLDEGELLTGTPSVDELYTSGLTITNKVVNTSTIEVKGRDCDAGTAVQFLVQGQTSGSSYRVQIKATTDSTPAQTIPGDVILNCV